MSSSTGLPSDAMAPDEFGGGTAAACVILGLSFLVGFPGNLLVIWTILRHVQRRSHTVVLMLHLAAADLLVLVTLPLWIYSLARSWVFGEVSCKAVVYVINACMYSSVFLITLMSVERCVAIRYPFKMMVWKGKSAMNRFLAVIWLLSILLGIPAILFQSIDEIDGTKQCLFKEYNSVVQEAIGLFLETLVGFVAPFSILAVSYCLMAAELRRLRSSTKQKSTVLISSVVIAFALCWLPYHVLNTVELVSILAEGPDAGASNNAQGAVFISGALAFISSSVNPLLYNFAARNFQDSLQESRLVRLFQEMASQTSRLRGTNSLPSDGPEGNNPLEGTNI